MKKKFIVTLLVIGLLAMSLVLNGCGSGDQVDSSTKEPENKEPYKIGLLTTLSGPLAFLGKDIRDTTQMEIDKINAEGGINGHPIELVVEDDGMDPGKAVAGFTKLARQDKVLAVTGMTITHLEAAIRPIAEREKVTFLAVSPTLPELRARKDKYAFNTAANEFNNVAPLFEILKLKGLKRVVAISTNDQLSIITLEQMKKEAAANGVTVEIMPEMIETNAVDVTPQVTKLKEFVAKVNADVVVSAVWPSNLGGMMSIMKQLGVNLPIVSYSVAADNSFLAMGGNEINGLLTPGVKTIAGETLPDSDPQKAVVVDFNKRYQAKFNMVPGTMAAGAHDSIHIIANALKTSGADREKLREATENTKNLVGVFGIFNYSADDHEGMAKGNFALYEIINKKFVLMK